MENINSIDDFIKVLNYYGIYQERSLYKIVCPFHNDINASFLINIPEKRFYCFGCMVSGTGIDFVRLAENIESDLELLFKYNRILKSKKNKNLVVNKKFIQKQKKDNIHALRVAKDYYQNLSKTDWNEDTKEREYLLVRGLQISTLEKCGAKINFNQFYPIIFPMRDMGEFKGWVCRTTNTRTEKIRKYLYNEGFSRATTLVGKYDNDTVLLIEGYFDYLKSKQLGVTYSAAILGWKLSEEQKNKLKSRGVKTIISALDNDKCGIEGTDYLKTQGFDVVRFPYPKGCKDMGEISEKKFKMAKLKLKEEGYELN